MLKYPVLTRPTRFQYFEIAILFSQSLKVIRKIRALCKISIEVSAYYPMVFFLGCIAVKNLYFNTRKIVRHNVSRHKNSFGHEVINFLYARSPTNIIFKWEISYLFFMHIPQHIIATFTIGFELNRVQNVNGILILTKQNNSHNKAIIWGKDNYK